PYTTLFRSRVKISSHKYAVLCPKGLGGFPFPLLFPLLKGKKKDLEPANFVHIYTSSVSTAKCTTQRPNCNKGLRLSRSYLYCLMPCTLAFCPVQAFLSSKVAIGKPLRKITISISSRKFSVL